MPPKKGYKKKSAAKGKGRRPYRRRGASVHGVKKFCSMFKLSDVIAPANGLLPDGIQVYNIKSKLTSVPLVAELSRMYAQLAFTGFKIQYRTTNPTPSNIASNGTGIDSELAHPSVNMYFVEDKDTSTDLTATQFKSQDNVKRLVSHRNYNHYVRMPRPDLWQNDSAGHLIKTIGASKNVHWISVNSTYGMDLMHLAAQFAVEELPVDVPITVGGQKQGEIWVTAYVLAKEQRV